MISSASCATSRGCARSSRKFVSTAARMDDGAGVAVDDAQGMGAMGLAFGGGVVVGAGAILRGQNGALALGFGGRLRLVIFGAHKGWMAGVKITGLETRSSRVCRPRLLRACA